VEELAREPWSTYLLDGREYSLAPDRVFNRTEVDLLLPCRHLAHVSCIARHRNEGGDWDDYCPLDGRQIEDSYRVRTEAEKGSEPAQIIHILLIRTLYLTYLF
jgi:hypothetical protein